MTAHVKEIVQKVNQAHAAVGRGKSPFVVLPLVLWEQIEDTLAELGSPQLLKSITAGRSAYRRDRATPYTQVRKSVGLA